MFKRIAGSLPFGAQQELKRIKYRYQERRGTFRSSEPEFVRLRDWVRPGDWVIDIGANVGQYTLALSAIVGPKGRVIALEPIPHTFELLAANAALSEFRNVTLLNVAASDDARVVGMDLPLFASGLQNFYRASITGGGDASYQVMAVPVDCLNFAGPISLVKIDAEGHEYSVLKGMRALLEKYHPVLIVEGSDKEVENLLAEFGYSPDVVAGSPNQIYKSDRV